MVMRTKPIAHAGIVEFCDDTQSVSSNPPQITMKCMVFFWLSVTVREVDTLDINIVISFFD